MVATVTRLKAAATTVHYFEADGYYARNDPEHRKASGWYGEVAAEFGLHGPVKPRRFEALLAGYVPGTDIRLGRLRDGEHQHRPGVDVTFSAPKNVSNLSDPPPAPSATLQCSRPLNIRYYYLSWQNRILLQSRRFHA